MEGDSFDRSALVPGRAFPPTLDPRPGRRLDWGMKTVLVSLAIALLMVGCGEQAQKEAGKEKKRRLAPLGAEEDAVDWSKLYDRDFLGVVYLLNEDIVRGACTDEKLLTLPASTANWL